MNKDKYPGARNPWERADSPIPPPAAPGRQCHLQCPSPPQLSRFMLSNPQTTQPFSAQVCLSPNLPPLEPPLPSQPPHIPSSPREPRQDIFPQPSPAGRRGFSPRSPEESFPGVSGMTIPAREQRSLSGGPRLQGQLLQAAVVTRGHRRPLQP